MNLLIIGGLLVVGVAAIVGAVFLGLGEQRANTARNADLIEPSTPPERSAPVTRSEPALPRRGAQTVRLKTNALVGEDTLVPRGEEEHLPALNGQFHELAGEVRSLHQQAWQLEQRLSVLTEMVEHIEHRQSDHTNIEEESYNPADNTLA